MRCFVAIELSADVRSRLGALQRRLSGLSSAVRWIRAEQIHLTVKFLGEVGDRQVAEVCELARAIADEHPPFELQVAGVGCFPPQGAARIVWAGLASLPAALTDCQSACEEVFAGLGFKQEHRAYRAHLTIGRVREASASQRIREALRAEEGFAAGPFGVGELVVFQSVLGRGGSRYSPLARCPFGGGG